MNNDAMETAVEYMWVDVWCMLDWIKWIMSKDCRNVFPWHESLN